MSIFWYVVNRNKKWLWALMLIVFLGALETILLQVLYKFVGFTIDYGLGYNGTPYKGIWSFLFGGTFGDYGTLQLVTTLAIAIVLCALIAYTSNLLSNFTQCVVGQKLANIYRWEIFTKTKGKKLKMSCGDYLVFLQEDIYKPGNVFVTNFSGIIVNVISIIISCLMLGEISPILLIAPLCSLPAIAIFGTMYRKAIFKAHHGFRSVDGKLRQTIADIFEADNRKKVDTFDKLNVNHTRKRKILSSVSNKYETILNAIKFAIYIISCTIAGLLVIHGKILIGEYIIFTGFISTIFSQMLSIVSKTADFKAQCARINRVKAFMENLDKEQLEVANEK